MERPDLESSLGRKPRGSSGGSRVANRYPHLLCATLRRVLDRGFSRLWRQWQTLGGIRQQEFNSKRARVLSQTHTRNDTLSPRSGRPTLLSPELWGLRSSRWTDSRCADAGWTPSYQICTGAPDDKGPAVFFALHLG